MKKSPEEIKVKVLAEFHIDKDDDAMNVLCETEWEISNSDINKEEKIMKVKMIHDVIRNYITRVGSNIDISNKVLVLMKTFDSMNFLVFLDMDVDGDNFYKVEEIDKDGEYFILRKRDK